MTDDAKKMIIAMKKELIAARISAHFTKTSTSTSRGWKAKSKSARLADVHALDTMAAMIVAAYGAIGDYSKSTDTIKAEASRTATAIGYGYEAVAELESGHVYFAVTLSLISDAAIAV